MQYKTKSLAICGEGLLRFPMSMLPFHGIHK